MTIKIDSADLRLLERSEARAFRVERGGAFNAIFDVTEDQALDGQAVKFDTPFKYKGDWIALRAGCFGDTAGKRVGVWIDHEGALEVASTDDALEVMIDDDGVQFRLDLGSCKLGPVVARLCQSDNRSSMSVGSDILEEHKETIAGERVRVVTRAKLKEISLCKEGAAGENAYAFVVDKTVTPKPVAGTRSATMKAAQILHRVSRTVRRLKAQAVETYGDAKPAKRRPMTVSESNRLQSEQNERLIARTRAMHFF
ncbi:HK97 family phage prohead protease [Bradyrhizobium sp. AZCC 2230]|uniref:HK97 family phage prohead protease n=1 Tax=Bradyrhizobium sp. AZCC 2230 TaxID=3117021 RepID=UPI002FF07233